MSMNGPGMISDVRQQRIGDALRATPRGARAMNKGARGRRQPCVIVVALAVLFAGCGEPEPSDQVLRHFFEGRTGNTEEDIEVGLGSTDSVAQNQIAVIEPKRLSLPQDCAVRIGERETMGIRFDMVTGLAVIADTVLVVADAGYRNVRFVALNNPDSVLGEVGGLGDGPGEFRSLRGLSSDETNRVIAHDPDGQRVTQISWPSLEVQVHRIDHLADFTAGIGRRPELVGLMDDGRLAFRLYHRGRMAYQDVDEIIADTSAVALVDPASGEYTVVSRIMERPYLARELQGGRIYYAGMPLSVPPSYAAQGARLVLGSGNASLVEVRDVRGEIIKHIVWDAAPRVMDDDVWDEYRKHAMPRDGFRRELIEELLASDYAPEVMPAYDRIVSDRRDWIWVREYQPPWESNPGDPSRWLGFSERGALEVKVDTDRRFLLYDADERYLYGTVRGQLGVVEVCAIQRPS